MERAEPQTAPAQALASISLETQRVNLALKLRSAVSK